MKTYSIGRDLNCDIVINDSTDVISRRHALLNVAPSGKMSIIDQSSNGTYVNGIRISPNVPVPVTRKDVVSLAHVAKLDWNQVPKSNQWIKYTVIAVVAVVVIVGVIFGVKYLKTDNAGGGDVKPETTVVTDSTAIKQKEAAKLDSIKKAKKQDSIKKAADKVKRDEKKSQKKTEQSKKDSGKKNRGDKSKDKKGNDKSTQTKKRAIG